MPTNTFSWRLDRPQQQQQHPDTVNRRRRMAPTVAREMETREDALAQITRMPLPRPN